MGMLSLQQMLILWAYALARHEGLRMHGRTLTIGHIAAIPIRVHWSWLAVLLIVVVILSQIYAGVASGPGAWLLAACAGGLLWISVVLHELGHALAARRFRFTVHTITLFAIG